MDSPNVYACLAPGWVRQRRVRLDGSPARRFCGCLLPYPPWIIIDEAFNSDRLIEFLDALIKDAGKKVLLILDNLRVYHSQLIKA